MRLLKTIDFNNYHDLQKKYVRYASRAIIIKDNKILLVKSTKGNFYKFPGGGIEKGESKLQALVREVREETGLICDMASVKEYGYTLEKRRYNFNGGEIYEQYSYYYTINVKDEKEAQELDDYERDLGFVLEAVSIDDAINTNHAYNEHDGKLPYIKREEAVLRLVKKDLMHGR